jgi:hypothetical protein
MIAQSKKDFLLVYLFKIAMILHAICVLANFALHLYGPANSIFTNFINCGLLTSLICICIVASIKTMQFFTQNHEYLMQHYKFMGFLIESCAAAIISAILFFHKKITGKFIIFIADLSHRTHNNTLLVMIVLLTLYLCIKLEEAISIEPTSINYLGAKKHLKKNIILLSLKLFIIIGTAIGFLYPITEFLQPLQIQKFNSIIFRFTTTEFFLYIHTIIMILVGLWITLGIYFVYKIYKN